MALPILGGIISGLFGLGATAAQTSHESRIHSENLAMQRENLDWQRSQWAQAMAREDTAVQRRVADLKAAGLSPTLAAGSAAQSQSPISTQAPQRGVTNYARMLESLQVAQAYQAVAGQKADIARTNAETARIKELTANDIQERDLNYRDYLLRQEGVRLDQQRVNILAGQLHIDSQELMHDAERVAMERDRIDLEARRVFNDTERVQLDRHALELQRLMNEAQRGYINEQTFSEQLRHFGIHIDNETKLWDFRALVYDYTLLSNLGLPTRQSLPQLQQVNWARGEAATRAHQQALDRWSMLGTSNLGNANFHLMNSRRGATR